MDEQHRKREVRSALRGRRRALAASRDAAADDLALARLGLHLAGSLGLGAGSTVTLYAAWQGEPPTAGLLAALQASGVRVLLPITDPDLDLDWHDAADPAASRLGKDAIAEAGVVLAPGLAVDRDGSRLGQGGGCYDKALPRRGPEVPVVVLLHPGELADLPLPREPHDQAVDAVLTAEGVSWLTDRRR